MDNKILYFNMKAKIIMLQIGMDNHNNSRHKCNKINSNLPHLFKILNTHKTINKILETTIAQMMLTITIILKTTTINGINMVINLVDIMIILGISLEMLIIMLAILLVKMIISSPKIIAITTIILIITINKKVGI